ncbi:hypothetical protein [Priestia megaterium]|uniref:hypothetical protein n=1 Tax=Priestia megaterium TaxID=1404 RepID=UPI000BFB30D7|nr:hypothetical protein [Priestia megaterium]PGQ88242.1 hypothetical protein COA18_04765 [Priestia megaterium]
MIIKTVGTVVLKTGWNLMKIGGLTTVNQWTNQQLRNSANHLIGEVSRGAEHTARNLRLIKND